jgi:hypothetical protein
MHRLDTYTLPADTVETSLLSVLTEWVHDQMVPFVALFTTQVSKAQLVYHGKAI